MLFIGALIILAICALVGSTMARDRNRDPVLWGVICLITGLLGIIILALIGEEGAKEGVISSASTSQIDEKRWQTLIEVDSDIAQAASQARAISPRAESALADKYLTLNDKTYLSAMLKNILDHAGEYTDSSHASSPMRSGNIGGIEYKERQDQTYIITKGKYVGKVFRTFEDLEIFCEFEKAR